MQITKETLVILALVVIISTVVFTVMGSNMINDVQSEELKILESSVKTGSSGSSVISISIKNMGSKDIKNITGEMNYDYDFSAICQSTSNRIHGDEPGVWIDISPDQLCARSREGYRTSGKRMGWQKDFVPWANLGQESAQLQRRRTARHCHSMTSPCIFSKPLFKLGLIDTLRQGSVFSHDPLHH